MSDHPAEQAEPAGMTPTGPRGATGPGGAPSADPARPWSGAERLVAAAASLCVGAWVPIMQGVTPGMIAALALLPVWLLVLCRTTVGRWTASLGALALLSGILLTASTESSRQVSSTVLRDNSMTLFAVVGGVGVLLWARSVTTTRDTATWFGVGAVLAMFLRTGGEANPWKYDYSLPVTILVLALCLRSRSRLLQICVALGLALVSALNDSRSAASMLLIVAAIVGWQAVRASLRVRSTALRTLLQTVLIVVVVFFAMQTLLLDGYLGEDAQARTEAQITTSGSVLAGGRPEIGAAVELLRANPFGIGAGALPRLEDLNTAKAGMAALGYDPDNGYVERYLFGSGFEVHSVVGDLWIHFGLAGLAFGLTVLVVGIGRLAREVATNSAPALLVYLVVQCAWDFLFSPFFSTSATALILLAGIALPLRPRRARLDVVT